MNHSQTGPNEMFYSKEVHKPFAWVKKLDLFGKKVSLRFQGEDNYRTYCGAVATVFMFLALLILFTLSAKDIMKGKIETLGYMIKNTVVDEKIFS